MSDNANYTNKELLEAILDVRDRTTRIEEKLNRAEKLEDRVNKVEGKADDALDLAQGAQTLAENNKDEIKSMKANTKWAWGLALTAVIALAAEYFGVKIN